MIYCDCGECDTCKHSWSAPHATQEGNEYEACKKGHIRDFVVCDDCDGSCQNIAEDDFLWTCQWGLNRNCPDMELI